MSSVASSLRGNMCAATCDHSRQKPRKSVETNPSLCQTSSSPESRVCVTDSMNHVRVEWALYEAFVNVMMQGLGKLQVLVFLP